jgi:hypothetical protein
MRDTNSDLPPFVSFLNEVEEAEDGFDVVASMFSKGLFGQQQLAADRV